MSQIHLHNKDPISKIYLIYTYLCFRETHHCKCKLYALLDHLYSIPLSEIDVILHSNTIARNQGSGLQLQRISKQVECKCI